MEVVTVGIIAFLIIAVFTLLSRRGGSVALHLEAVPAGTPTTPNDVSAKDVLQPPVQAGSIQIVVAHHEKCIADTLAIILNQSGYSAKACYSGVDALEMVLDLKPKLAILCIVPANMRDLNGVYAGLVIRTLLPECTVFLEPGGSGYWVTQPLSLAHEKGFEFPILSMPVQPKDLLKKIESALGHPRAF